MWYYWVFAIIVVLIITNNYNISGFVSEDVWESGDGYYLKTVPESKWTNLFIHTDKNTLGELVKSFNPKNHISSDVVADLVRKNMTPQSESIGMFPISRGKVNLSTNRGHFFTHDNTIILSTKYDISDNSLTVSPIQEGRLYPSKKFYNSVKQVLPAVNVIKPESNINYC
jgi:hypothetical protein